MCVCVYVYICARCIRGDTASRVTRETGFKNRVYIGNTIHLVFPADREGIEETRGFLKKGWIGLGDNGSVLSFDRFGNRLEDF